jgi:hypothetical protein
MLEGFGDGQTLYLAEYRNVGEVRGVRGLRTADGVAAPVPNGPASVDAYPHKQRTVGRCLLLSDVADEKPTLRLYDVQTGKDVWKKTFAAKAVVLESLVADWAAVAEPDGTVWVIDLVNRKELFRLSLEKKHVEKLQRGALVRDRTQLYVLLQGPNSANQAGDAGPNFNFPQLTHWAAVNGRIYAFDRTSGEFHWHANAPAQFLLLEHFEESPLLLCASSFARMGANGVAVQAFATRFIDKLTGKVVYEKETVNSPDGPYHTLQVDARSGTVELANNGLKLRAVLEPTHEAAKP